MAGISCLEHAIKQLGLEQLIWVCLKGMATGKSSSEGPEVSSAKQEVLHGGRKTRGGTCQGDSCVCSLRKVQAPLEKYSQDWTLTPFRARQLG